MLRARRTLVALRLLAVLAALARCVVAQVTVITDVTQAEKCELAVYMGWANRAQMEEKENICRVALNKLRLDIAGKHGPVREEDIYEVMCSSECRDSDTMHEQVMADSHCTCRELSSTYSNLEADFCSANSARMLCKQYQPLKNMGTRVMDTRDNLWQGVNSGGKIQLKQFRPSQKFGYIDAVRISNWYGHKVSSKGSMEICGQWNCPLEDFMCPRYEWNRKWICDDASSLVASRAVLLTALLAQLLGFCFFYG